jgi:hypothetical protein
MNCLSVWTGVGNWTYTQGNTTVGIYDISVNPALAELLVPAQLTIKNQNKHPHFLSKN